MLIIFGKRTLRIKSYSDHTHPCSNCKSLDLRVSVIAQYFHIFFIPFAPTGIKFSKLWCHDCGQVQRIDSLQAEFEKKSRSPIYLYTLPILIGILIIAAVNEGLKNSRKEKEFIQNPKEGDVYIIRDKRAEKVRYYFMKVASVHEDTIATFHSNMEYDRYISSLPAQDSFVTDDELFYTKTELKKMLDDGEIDEITRLN